MISPRYESPTSIEGVVELLATDEGARILAGGTDLLVQIRLGGAPPTTFVDVKRIPELGLIDVSESGLRLGAAVSAAEIFENEPFRQRWPGVAEATDLIGSTQIQGRATLAGNLCNASPAADGVPALIAAGAQVRVAGPRGERNVEVEKFTTGPGTNVLGPGEFVVEILVPEPAPRSADAYLRLIPRSEMDIAVAGAAVQITRESDGRVGAARVVLGAVAPTAILAPDAATALLGSRLEAAALEHSADAARAASAPIDDRRAPAAYRRQVVGVLVKRAAWIAFERAGERN